MYLYPNFPFKTFNNILHMVDTVKYPDRSAMLSLLDQEKIPYKIYDHEALDTMQAGLEHFSKNKPDIESYTFAKNLFLKNKAGGFFLCTLHNDSPSDFKTLTKLFKAKSGNIRQAEEDKLDAYLHVKHGSVTPLALLNLTEAQKKDYNLSYGVQVNKLNSGRLKDAGVPEKFIILKINNQSVRTVADVEKLFKSAQNSEEQTLWIYGKNPAGQQRSFAVLLSDE